jgi:Zn-dependent peptidase ImmA (M78 family)
MSRVEVPITPSVLKWAIDESGYTLPEVSEAIDGREDLLASWLEGESLPSLTEAKAVARKLHRQLATFLLPAPPSTDAADVKFRHPMGTSARQLNPTERRYLRRATRLQRAFVWMLEEMKRPAAGVPQATIAEEAVVTAAVVRKLLRVTATQQKEWKSASRAFDAWRESVENLGVIVLLFSMGKDAVRGFSLWHPAAPVVVINTAWTDEARIFTLFHELGHLVTRSNSACAAVLLTGDPRERAERWCERFAAAVLLPSGMLDEIGTVSDLKSLGNLARKYKVSLTAMALQLIHLGKGKWTLLNKIPVASDSKKDSGFGPARNRRERREDEIGKRGSSVFVDAVKKDVLGRSEALDYLDIPHADFELWLAEARSDR